MEAPIKAEVIPCTRTDQFADAYTEFAPEPIVIVCREPARALFTEPSVTDGTPEQWVVCTKHALEMAVGCMETGTEFSLRALSMADRVWYASGWNAGQAVVLDGPMVELISYMGFGEQGVATPTDVPEMYSIGWTDGVGQRVFEWISTPEQDDV